MLAFHSFEEEAARNEGRAAIIHLKEAREALEELVRSSSPKAQARARAVLAMKYDSLKSRWVSPESQTKPAKTHRTRRTRTTRTSV